MVVSRDLTSLLYSLVGTFWLFERPEDGLGRGRKQHCAFTDDGRPQDGGEHERRHTTSKYLYIHIYIPSTWLLSICIFSLHYRVMLMLIEEAEKVGLIFFLSLL